MAKDFLIVLIIEWSIEGTRALMNFLIRQSFNIDAIFYFQKRISNPLNSFLVDYQQILTHLKIPDNRNVVILNSVSLSKGHYPYFKVDFPEEKLFNDFDYQLIPSVFFGKFREILQNFRFKIPLINKESREVRICFFQDFKYKGARNYMQYFLN